MAQNVRITEDPEALKPIVEALIFAAEEPIPLRMLMKLLSGETENGTKKKKRKKAKKAEAQQSDDQQKIDAGETEGEEAGRESAADADAEKNEPNGEKETSADDADGNSDGADDTEESTTDDDEEGDEEQQELFAVNRKTLYGIVDELNAEYEEAGRAFRILEVAGGFQFATLREYGEYVALLSREKMRRRLSAAALETLAIVAYRQPVSKPEIESIRGVNCDQVLVSLMEKNLITIVGRSEGVGRPLLYGSTEDFLRSFGLKNISDLPKLREIEELMEDDVHSAERAEVITVDEGTEVEEIEARVGAAGRGKKEAEETSGEGEEASEETEGEEAGGRDAPEGADIEEDGNETANSDESEGDAEIENASDDEEEERREGEADRSSPEEPVAGPQESSPEESSGADPAPQSTESDNGTVTEHDRATPAEEQSGA